MGVIAQWGPHKWELTSDSVKTIEKLTFSWSLNTDSKLAASGKAVGSSNEDLSIVPVTFSTNLLAATGADVRKEIESYEQSIGGVYPLLIGGKQLGPNMQLMTVAASEGHLSGSGEMVAATVTFTFNEFNPKKREKASSSASTASSSLSTASGGGLVVDADPTENVPSVDPTEYNRNLRSLEVRLEPTSIYQVGTSVRLLFQPSRQHHLENIVKTYVFNSRTKELSVEHVIYQDLWPTYQDLTITDLRPFAQWGVYGYIALRIETSNKQLLTRYGSTIVVTKTDITMAPGKKTKG